MSVMLCKGATFVNIPFCLVARIVLPDTAGLHILTFCILEPYSFKVIEFDVIHIISH